VPGPGMKIILIVLFITLSIAFLTVYDTKVGLGAKTPTCSDGTIYDTCSRIRPYYCMDGQLIKSQKRCGCPKNMALEDSKCVMQYSNHEFERQFEYVLNGEIKTISLNVNKGLNQHLKNLPRTYFCDSECPTREDLLIDYIEEEEQKIYLIELVDKIRAQNPLNPETDNADDWVRIAVSLVQRIPYDKMAYATEAPNLRYPYEVLFDNKGVCEEKSKLLAFILKELGYGIALIDFENEQHMAVGIKCKKDEHSQEDYIYKNSDYCFIETTAPTIITNDQAKYINIEQLGEPTQIIEMSDGITFDASQEWIDANELEKINKIGRESEGILDRPTYDKWMQITTKYRLKNKN